MSDRQWRGGVALTWSPASGTARVELALDHVIGMAARTSPTGSMIFVSAQ